MSNSNSDDILKQQKSIRAEVDKTKTATERAKEEFIALTQSRTDEATAIILGELKKQPQSQDNVRRRNALVFGMRKIADPDFYFFKAWIILYRTKKIGTVSVGVYGIISE